MTRLSDERGVAVLPPPKDFEGRSLLASRENLPGLNAFTVAWGLFELEKQLRGQRVSRAVMPIYEPTALGYDLETLSRYLQELILFVFAEKVAIEFKRISLRGTAKASEAVVTKKVANLCLFSGGVDSYSGILLAKQQLGDVQGVFCGHADQSKASNIVTNLEEEVLRPRGIELVRLRAPRIGTDGYAQLRGFFYIVAAGSWLQLLHASRLLVTECGPTMYQPRFGPFDAVTMTTHPRVVELSSAVLNLLLAREVQISIPFENFTKAEVMAAAPEKKGLRLTHSCITQRFGYHDGTCYGCVIRRLAALAADVPDVDYQRDPLVDSSANGSNLLALLMFCSDLLMHYEDMDSYETEKIEQYNKLDLFRRFALDNLGAIHRLVGQGVVVRPSVKGLYDEVLKKIGRVRIERRLNSLYVKGKRDGRKLTFKGLEPTA